MAGEWGWRLHWQDFTHHRHGLPKPDPQFRDFQSREEAEGAKRRLVTGPEIVATVAPVPMPKATPRPPSSPAPLARDA